VTCIKCHDPARPAGKLADYARLCGACHTPRYETLLYDWAKALQERDARATAMLKSMRVQHAEGADALARRIDEARAVGLHNVLLARQLWDDILASETVPGPSPPPLARRQ